MAENEIPRQKKNSVNRVINRNIGAIIRHRRKQLEKRSLQERIANIITDFSGTMIFVYIHITWFTIWVLLNTGRYGIEPFDPFPYGLLTMIVSLEAIFLSTFVLISQNQMSKESENRAELDLQINLLTERELTLVLVMLDSIQDKLGIDNETDWELTELEQVTNPEEVLQAIEKKQEHLQKR
jgi:uncharacterized membrane protein